MKWKFWILIVVFLAGCRSIGPKEIELDRNPYNDAVITTEDEQLLRNIVRLRYLQPISFLKINNITASYTFNPSTSSSFVFGGSWAPGDATTTRSMTLSPSISYSDSPTISYTPVTSTDFIREMLPSIPLGSLALLLNGGMHDTNLLFKLVLNTAGDIDNAIEAVDLKTLSPPKFQEFYYLTCMLSDLVKKKGARQELKVINGISTIVFHFNELYRYSCEAMTIKRLLHIPQTYNDIILSQDGRITLPNAVQVTTRSILGIMIFLSHGVEVPCEHIENKRALQYHVCPSMVYNWEPLMHGIIAIHSSLDKPICAYVKVHIYGYWYYIDWSVGSPRVDRVAIKQGQ